MPTQEYIALISIDAKKNKWRVYTIQVSFLDTHFVVVCSWGRLHRYRRSIKNTFDEKESMEKFVETLLKRRNRSGYHIIDKSQNFPNSPTLSVLPVTDNIAGQLRLF